jgi:hypothetical protein
MKIQIINNPKEWDNLLEQCSFYTFFHTWEWREIVSKSYGFKPMYFLLDDSFIFPCFKIKKLWKSYFVSMPLAEYGGIIPLSKDLNLDEMLYIFNSLSELFKCIIKVEIHPFIFKNFLKSRGDSDSRLNSDIGTYLLELNKSYEKVMSSFRRDITRNIKKGYKNNLKLVKNPPIKELEKIYPVYLHTSKRNKAIPSSFRFLYELSKSQNAHIYIIKDEKENIISSAVFLECMNILQYYKSATYSDYFELRPVHFLLSEVIKEYSNTKIEYLDFGAVRKGDSLETFKKGWGAKGFDILRYSNAKDSFEIEKLSAFRNYWGKMPLTIIKHLSPYLYKYVI